VRIPAAPIPPGPPLARSVAGCIAAIAEPARFNWPGPWIALFAGDDGESIAAVAFGSPPGIVWHPLGGDEPFERVVAGYLLAPADVALWAPRPGPGGPARDAGRVEVIAVSETAEAPMRVLDRVVALAGRGLEGDRYARGAGTFTSPGAPGHDITLIEAESLDALVLPSGRPLAPEDARRNLVTRGIDLNALVGRRFRVGDVECVGRRLCEPCAHLERLTERGTLRGLVHRGGLRADLLTGGVIEAGAEVVALEDARG
jgi:MOSC domain-containing protein YiiM